MVYGFFFFFSSRRRHTRCGRDWSSDVCSSDLARERALKTDFVTDTRVEAAERALIKRLCELPGEVAETAARRAPHRLCAYATEVARDFHAFYRDCQVIGA